MDEKQVKELKKFSLKTEINTLKAVSKLFPEVDDPYSDNELLNIGNVCVMDPCNICMIVSKTEQGVSILKRFKCKDQIIPHIPNLEYDITDKDVGFESVSQYDIKYLTAMLNILTKSNADNSDMTLTKVKMFIKPDYPLTLENNHFKIILAPRINYD